MKTVTGLSGKWIEIDVGARTWKSFETGPDMIARWIGGKGVALALYDERLGDRLASVDPLGPDNLLVLSMGLLLGSGAPCSGRFSAVTKSPLTGLMAHSSCGGPFGMALKTAGWDGAILRGASARPVTVYVDQAGATFEDADSVWGLETGEAQERALKGPRDGALVIGPAGENLVKYANVRSGNRYLGRGGFGAVLGAKKVKAIVARGMTSRVVPAEPKRFARNLAKARKHVGRNSFTRKLAAYGTCFNVNPGVDAGYAPVHNFRDRTDERCRALSGEAMAERYKTRHSTCAPCSVLCGHAGTWPDGKERHVPEYETVGLWGGNLGVFDPDIVGRWNETMNELGLDTISAGGTFAWAMEAAEKGIRKSALAFGKTDDVERTLRDVAARRGEGDELAEGARALARKYGGEDFAIQVKGLEMAAYDPRAAWGHGLGYAVANRGACHLSSYTIALESIFRFIPGYTAIGKAEWVDFMEDFFAAVNSLQTCQFTTFGYLLEPPIAKYTPKFLLGLVMLLAPRLAQLFLDWSALSGFVRALTGVKMSPRDFMRAGRRIHLLERRMNCDLGVRAEDDTLPRRFLEEARTKHPRDSVVPLEKMKRRYYRIKGYDADGRPTARTLARYGVHAGRDR